MSFFQRPIIQGIWSTGMEEFVFKAFHEDNKTVKIRIYRGRGVLTDREIESMSFTMSYECFYTKFVPILNTNEKYINDAGKQIHGTWKCLPEDKTNVMANMPSGMADEIAIKNKTATNEMQNVDACAHVQGESTTIPKTNNRMKFAQGANIRGQQPGDVFGGKSCRRGKRSNKRSNKRSRKTRHRRSRR